jgi:ferrochelatase
MHADALRSALGRLDARRPMVAFTAHSLPCEDADEDAAYTLQLQETADAVALQAALGGPGGPGRAPFGGSHAFGAGDGPIPWVVAYQSRGQRDCAWLEPALESVMDEAKRAGSDGIVVSPIGFVTDHMETRYDLDIVAREHAQDLGMGFVRAAAPNDDERMIGVLADAVFEMLPDPV